ncbi:hypothetical protein [Parafrankia sp. EUN1f]|uniref:hypothetical protein n=1 Tax=Parafrankia sp. EUN1f TaxID=102897 RepID=UPI0001C462F3|nr:hypothetical protein [Parafrankia sp. EUN1f]EFC82253.1 hypothetical protein FrEUN1fDRAFT_4642 [Parafrankia sp. EUN1f]
MSEPEACWRCRTVPPGRRGRHPTCFPCRVTLRLQRLLDDGSGAPHPDLAPLIDHLKTDPDPRRMLGWLARPHTADLLIALASGQVRLAHEALHIWPHQVAVRRLRHHLIAAGILPDADPRLLDIEAWLHRRLDQLAGHPHEQLLRQFALWHLLPRLRATAAGRPLRTNAHQYATQQFTQAQTFLTWLHDQQLRPHQLRQADIDTWNLTHRVHQRELVRGFLLWAIDRGDMPRHLVAPRLTFQPGTPITQHRRLALLRRFTTDDSQPLPIRAVACLVLLYAQPLSRIHRLTTDDILDRDGEMLIRLGDPPTPVPDPFAALLRELAAAAPPAGWLIPGRFSHRPAHQRVLQDQLKDLGVPIQQARVAALRQLVLQAPAPVIAEALGYHPTATTRQHTHAGGTWNRYTALPRRPAAPISNTPRPSHIREGTEIRTDEPEHGTTTGPF